MPDPVYLSTDPNAGVPVADAQSAVHQAKAKIDAGQPVPHPIAKMLLGLLPAGLSIFGSGAGEGIASIPMAALGGAAGSALEQAGNAALGNTPAPSLGTAAETMATQGALQGAAEGAGKVVMAAAKPLATTLMRSAINPTLKMLGDVLETGDTPRVVQVALDARGAVYPSGVKRLVAARDAATTAKDAIVANLPGSVSPTVIAQPAQDYVSGLAVPTDRKSAQKVLDTFVNAYVRDPDTGQMRPWLTPEATDALKTQYRQGVNFGKMSAPVAETRKALARGAKEALEGIDPTKTTFSFGDLSAANAKAGALIDATKATSQANARWQNQTLATRFLQAAQMKSPSVNSFLARGLYDQAAAIAGVPATAMRLAAFLVDQASTPAPPSQP